jgi:uncharacterized membrane protein
MNINIKKVVLSIVLLICLDFIFLNLFADNFKQQVLNVQHSPMRLKLLPSIVCYIVLVFGINYFILQRDSKVLDAILLGIVINTVYETTNMAIFDKWDVKLVIVDSLWGGILFGSTTFIINNLLHYNII